MKQKTRQVKAYKLNISQTDENGAFQCPNCRQTISPDDHSEETYMVCETSMIGNYLTEVVLCCKGCLNFIHLVGFQKLAFLKINK